MISDTWASLVDGDLYVDWPIGPVAGLIDKSGIYNTEPLLHFIQNWFKKYNNETQRKFVVASGEVNSGSYILWNETATDIPKAIVSSAAIPMLFPSQNWGNNIVAMDGGAVYGTNIVSAINRCREIVGDKGDRITLDIIVT